MSKDLPPGEESPLFRWTSFCLMLLGCLCMIITGAFMLRYAIGRDGTGKFIIFGMASIVVPALLVGYNVHNLFVKKK